MLNKRLHLNLDLHQSISLVIIINRDNERVFQPAETIKRVTFVLVSIVINRYSLFLLYILLQRLQYTAEKEE